MRRCLMESEVPENIEETPSEPLDDDGGAEGPPPVLLRDPKFDVAPWVVFLLGLGAWVVVFSESVL